MTNHKSKKSISQAKAGKRRLKKRLKAYEKEHPSNKITAPQVWAVLDKHFPKDKKNLIKSINIMYTIMTELFGKNWYSL